MNPPGPERQFRILFVLENYHPNIGGVETLFKTLAERLAGEGHSITIVTTRLSAADPAEERLGNIRIFRFRFLNRYFFTLLALFPALKHARDCDLVHTTSYNAALPAWAAARLRRRKVVVTFHEVWGKMWFRLPYMSRVGEGLHYLFEQMLLRLPFDRFVAVSGSTAQGLRQGGVAEAAIRTIYNGIEYSHFAKEQPPSAIPHSPFTFTYFGRLGVSKGLDVLLEGARSFRQKHPDSRFKLIIPTTPAGFFRKIRSELAAKGLQDDAVLLHHLPFEVLKRELLTSHCVVIPSLNEGFCFAAAECAALGVPVVSSCRGALREVVSGRFIKMKDLTPPALAEALELAAAGRWQERPLRRFELNDTVENYLRLYRELMAAGIWLLACCSWLCQLPTILHVARFCT
jgi:glycosyltransferase involved in cell wall biosynthesis